MIQNLKIPLILIAQKGEICSNEGFKLFDKVIDIEEGNNDIHTKQVQAYASKYEDEIESSFFHLVKKYVQIGENQFNCHEHHSGLFFGKHPVGKYFINFLGKKYI